MSITTGMPLAVLLEMDMRTFQTVVEVAGEIQKEADRGK